MGEQLTDSSGSKGYSKFINDLDIGLEGFWVSLQTMLI